MPETQAALRATVEVETRRFTMDEHNLPPFVVTSVEAPRLSFSRFVNEDDSRKPHSTLNLHGVTAVCYDEGFQTILVSNENGEHVRINIHAAEGGMRIAPLV
jgi:hypothetical protein